MKPAPRMMLIFLLSIASCAAGRDAILSRTMAGLGAAERAFVTWDAHHQAELVDAAVTREGGAQALADYRAKRRVAVAAMVAAYGALAAASVDLSEESLTSAARATAATLAALRNLGVIP